MKSNFSITAKNCNILTWIYLSDFLCLLIKYYKIVCLSITYGILLT